MAKDPAFLFYSQDFFLGTATLSFEDRGKYITILCLMHQQGRMSEESICFIVGLVSLSLRNKFSIDEHGLWYNERLEIEVEKRNNFTNSRRENGSKGGRGNKKQGGKANGKHMVNHMEDENENEIVNRNKDKIAFDEFWNLYNNKVGSKAGCKKKWDALKLSEQEEIMQSLPDFLKYKPFKEYTFPYPETYLNQRRWENEGKITPTNAELIQISHNRVRLTTDPEWLQRDDKTLRPFAPVEIPDLQKWFKQLEIHKKILAEWKIQNNLD